ncbi:MAG: hypothetical protein GXO36_05880 [Chloroflexi bacterium]|nr:hypothetical protein [Chloroflexota bacterium]
MDRSVFHPERAQTRPRFEVGDLVEVYCDHENDQGERVRGWLEGVVVQADYKMVAVQFNRPVYLTNGWLIPDQVLWVQQHSEQIRPRRRRRRRRSTKK